MLFGAFSLSFHEHPPDLLGVWLIAAFLFAYGASRPGSSAVPTLTSVAKSAAEWFPGKKIPCCLGCLLPALFVGLGWGVQEASLWWESRKIEAVVARAADQNTLRGLHEVNRRLMALDSRYPEDKDQVGALVLQAFEKDKSRFAAQEVNLMQFLQELEEVAPAGGADLTSTAARMAAQTPAQRLSRIHEKKILEAYASEPQFRQNLEWIAEKTGATQEQIASRLVKNWRTVWEARGGDQAYNLLWFTQTVNRKIPGDGKKHSVSEVAARVAKASNPPRPKRN